MANEQPYHDGGTLRELYCEKDLGIAKIADRFGVAPSTIWEWLDRNGIETSTFDSAETRFERQYVVDEDTGCWEWTGAKHNYGYGQIGVNGRQTGAHRFSYELHHGEIPDGAFICHKCHNPSCVNPDHLYAGDPKSNAEDMVEAGRAPKPYGTKQGSSALSESEVVDIRERYADGDTVANLANEHEVSMGTLSRVVNGESYPNVGGPTDVDTHERMANRGEDGGNSKLTADEVREIRRVYADEDVSMADVGDRFEISSTQVCDIVNRNTWQHVE